jgi:hypothetical protein
VANLELGSAPTGLTVRLVRGSDFVAGIDSNEGDWPVGVTIRLVFNDAGATTWDATVSGAAADWNVDKAAVDTLITASPKRVRLLYVDGTTDLVWAQGDVRVIAW